MFILLRNSYQNSTMQVSLKYYKVYLAELAVCRQKDNFAITVEKLETT